MAKTFLSPPSAFELSFTFEKVMLHYWWQLLSDVQRFQTHLLLGSVK